MIIRKMRDRFGPGNLGLDDLRGVSPDLERAISSLASVHGILKKATDDNQRASADLNRAIERHRD